MLSFEITVHVRFVFHYFIYVHTCSLHVYLWFHEAGVRRQTNDCTVRAVRDFFWDTDIDLIDSHYRMIYQSLDVGFFTSNFLLDVSSKPN